MALEEIVVDGYQVTITPIAPSTNSPGPYDGFSIVQTISTKNKIENNGIINGPTIAWSTNATCSKSGTGSGSFVISSPTKVKSESQSVFCKGAKANCSGTYWIGIFPQPCACQLEITDAGQTSTTGQ